MSVKSLIKKVLVKKRLTISIGQKITLASGKRGELLDVHGSYLSIGKIDKYGSKICQRTGQKIIKQKTFGISKDSFLQLVSSGDISYE